MSSEECKLEPREFVYLDEESINGHLSSMGVGIATGGQRGTDRENESQSRFGAVLPVFSGIMGGETSEREVDSEHFQQQIELTAPISI